MKDFIFFPCMLVFLLTLSACGGGSGDKKNSAEENNDAVSAGAVINRASAQDPDNLVIANVTDGPEGLIGAVSLKGVSGEYFYIKGSRDDQNNITSVSSATLVTTDEDGESITLTYYFNDDGLLSRLEFDGGWIEFSNYKYGSVTLSIYSENGSFVGSSQMEIDPKEIDLLKNLFLGKSNRAKQKSSTKALINRDNPNAAIAQWIGTGINWGSCLGGAGATAVLAGGVVTAPIAVAAGVYTTAACGSAVLSTVAAVTDSKWIDRASVTVNGGMCAAFGFLNPFDCVPSALDAVNAGLTGSPAAYIHAPANGAVFSAGDTVSFFGGAAERYDTVDEYLWDFGTFTNGYGKDVHHPYAAPGDYTVELQVTYANGVIRNSSINITVEPDGTVLPPSALTVTPGDSQNTLSWTAGTGAQGYNVYMSTLPGLAHEGQIVASNVSATSFVHTSLQNSTAYYYVVRSVGVLLNESAPSLEASGMPDATFRNLQIALDGSGQGSVVSEPAGINCGTICDVDFEDGTVVTLTASPIATSTFAGWSGACGGTSPTCTVSMSQARSVTATFNTQSGGGTPIGDRYQIIEDGSIVRDVVTGLEWQRCSVGQTWTGSTCSGTASTMNWSTATAQTAPGGFRLPTLEELKSLVYCSSGDPGYWNIPLNQRCQGSYARPTIDQTAFPNTPSSHFWSASSYAGDSVYAWRVDFFNGVDHWENEGYGRRVRLVRGGS